MPFMWLRRAFFGWLFPAAFILPAWLFVGWAVFSASGWPFVWLLLAIPSVFVGQLVSALLVRSRTRVRAQRAVSWWDVIGFGLWHALTISLGFFVESWWVTLFVATVAVGIGLFWLLIWQLLRQARPAVVLHHTSSGIGYVPPPAQEPRDSSVPGEDVYIISENPAKR